MSTNERLVIVMPAYNEAGCIGGVVHSWLKLLDRHPGGRMVVVNDGSKDETGALLDGMAKTDGRLSIVHQANQGHGAALLNAYRKGLELPCDWIFHVDSDDQFLPVDFEKLWAKRNSSRFITGFRQARHDAWYRLIITRIVRALNFFLFGVWIKDSNVPYRLIKADFLRRLIVELPPAPFAPNIFLAVMAAKSGETLYEIPISHQERTTGQVSILRWKLIKVCLRSARELMGFRRGLSVSIGQLKAHA